MPVEQFKNNEQEMTYQFQQLDSGTMVKRMVVSNLLTVSNSFDNAWQQVKKRANKLQLEPFVESRVYPCIISPDTITDMDSDPFLKKRPSPYLFK